MQAKLLVFMSVLISFEAFAFVAGPRSLAKDENQIQLGVTLERGKAEPHADRASYTDAEINHYVLSYSRGIGDVWVFANSTLRLDYGQFTSPKEEINGTLFYPSDDGQYAGVTFAGDFVHELDRVMTFFVKVNPYRDYNEEKFSNPRIDRFSFGATSSFNITDSIYQKNLFAYGSGDGSEQNPYIAIEHGYGYKLSFWNAAVSASLFLEADLKDRFDSRYDQEFSDPGERDRIRAMKYGYVTSFNSELTQNSYLSFDYLSKKGGYDARATKVYNFNLGFRF